MGKGDRRTRRGKIYRSSYGKVRPHRSPAADARAAERDGKGKGGARKRAS